MTGRGAASVHPPERQALLLLAQGLRVPLAQVSAQEQVLLLQELVLQPVQLLEPQLGLLPQLPVRMLLQVRPQVPQMALGRPALQLLARVLREQAPLASVRPLPLPAFHLAVRICAF